MAHAAIKAFCRRSVCLLTLLALSSSPAQARESGWTGFAFTLHKPDTATQGWLHVRHLAINSPAAQAGLRPGDVITHIERKAIAFTTDRDALDYFASLKPGRVLRFTVVRQGQRLELRLKTAAAPPEQARRWKENYDKAASTHD